MKIIAFALLLSSFMPGTAAWCMPWEEECNCDKCVNWRIANKNRAWIDLLPKCPCSIVNGARTCTVRPSNSDYKTGICNGYDWDTDLAANPCVPAMTHPGAYACIRTEGPVAPGTSTKTGQQCCYDEYGDIIPHGDQGAGTPDYNYPSHKKADYDPYVWCCSDCDRLCHLYIGTKTGKQGARSDPRTCSVTC